MKNSALLFATLLIGIALASCGGGGGSLPSTGAAPKSTAPSTTAPQATASSPAGTLGNVRFGITIPPAGTQILAHRARTQYVSVNATSMTVSVNGGTAQTIALTPATNSNCVVTASGATSCTNLSVQAEPGSDTFALTLYAGLSTIVATYTTPPLTVVQGVNNTLGTYTLDPVVASYTIGAPWTWTPGSPISYPLIVTATDSSGATIIGPGDYVNASGVPTPISLALTAGSDGGEGAFTIGTTPLYGSPQAPSSAGGTLNGPGDVATIYYSGAAADAWSLGTTGPNPTAPSIALSPSASVIYQTGPILAGPSFINNSVNVLLAEPIAPFSGSVTGFSLNATVTCIGGLVNCDLEVPFAQAGWVNPSGTVYQGTSGSLNGFLNTCSDYPPFPIVEGYDFGVTSVGVTVFAPLGGSGGPQACSVSIFGGGGQVLEMQLGVNFTST